MIYCTIDSRLQLTVRSYIQLYPLYSRSSSSGMMLHMNTRTMANQINGNGRVDEVSLVGYHDPNFVAWSSRMKQIKSTPRRRNQLAADYTHALIELEECVRQVLGQYVSLSEARVLRQCCPGARSAWDIGYREMDAVTIIHNQPAWAVEVKFHENGHKALSGFGQLERSLGLIHKRWPTVNGLFVAFWMSVFGKPDSEPVVLTPVADLLELLKQPPVQCVARICVDVRELIDLAVAKGFWSEAQTQRLVSLREAAINPLSVLPSLKPIEGGLNSFQDMFAGLQLMESAA